MTQIAGVVIVDGLSLRQLAGKTDLRLGSAELPVARRFAAYNRYARLRKVETLMCKKAGGAKSRNLFEHPQKPRT